MKKYDVVIIGDGYVGVEMADELLSKRRNAAIVEMLDRRFPNTVDPEFGNKSREILEARGGEIFVGHRVEGISEIE